MFFFGFFARNLARLSCIIGNKQIGCGLFYPIEYRIRGHVFFLSGMNEQETRIGYPTII